MIVHTTSPPRSPARARARRSGAASRKGGHEKRASRNRIEGGRPIADDAPQHTPPTRHTAAAAAIMSMRGVRAPRLTNPSPSRSSSSSPGCCEPSSSSSSMEQTIVMPHVTPSTDCARRGANDGGGGDDARRETAGGWLRAGGGGETRETRGRSDGDDGGGGDREGSRVASMAGPRPNARERRALTRDRSFPGAPLRRRRGR